MRADRTAEPIEVLPLVHAEDWTQSAASDDPLADHQPAQLICPASGWGDEFGTLEVSTSECNYLSVEQPLAEAIEIGDELRVQVHYNMVDPEVLGQSDSTTVNIRLEPEVAREGYFDLPDGLLATLIDGTPHPLAPGQDAETFTWSFPVDWYTNYIGANEVELWGFFPHMHERGTKLNVRVLDSEGQEVGCIADVPRWDFGWQLDYFYEQPIVLEKGQTIEVTCTDDTSGDDEAIYPGWGTYNEMCLTGLYLVPTQ